MREEACSEKVVWKKCVKKEKYAEKIYTKQAVWKLLYCAECRCYAEKKITTTKNDIT